MTALAALLKREPAMSAGITAAVVALAAAFGLSLSAPVVGSILAVLTLVLGAVVRSRVSPVAPKARATAAEHAAP